VHAALRAARTRSLPPAETSAALARRPGPGPFAALTGPATVLLDVREPAVFAGGHAAGARNVPLYSPLESAADGFDRLRQVYFALFGLRVPVRNEAFAAQVLAAVGRKARKTGPVRLGEHCTSDVCSFARACAGHADRGDVPDRRHARDDGGAQGERAAPTGLCAKHVLSLLRCIMPQARNPRLPAPLYGKFGAASRSLMVRWRGCVHAKAHCLTCIRALRAQAAHELLQAGFTRVSHAVRRTLRIAA
jgi:hypothetical protein